MRNRNKNPCHSTLSRLRRKRKLRLYRRIAALVLFLMMVTATPFVIFSFAKNQSTPPVKVTVSEIPNFTVAPTETATTNVPVKNEKTYSHIADIPLSFDLQETMQKACEKYGVPYVLALAVAECESSFNLEADSGICWGLMQIHPINYSRLRKCGIEPTEYEGNITAGVFLLGELLEKYADTHKALMAYNCGESGAKNLWNEGYLTSQYSVKVVTQSEKWQKIINDNQEEIINERN